MTMPFPRSNTPVSAGCLDDRELLAALETTGTDDLAAAFGGHTRAKTDLAGALLAMRAECGLHGLLEKRGSEVPDRPGGVKGAIERRFSPGNERRRLVPLNRLRGFAWVGVRETLPVAQGGATAAFAVGLDEQGAGCLATFLLFNVTVPPACSTILFTPWLMARSFGPS